MNLIEIPAIGKKVEYPSLWEECSKEQLLYIFRQALILLDGKMDLLEFKIRVFYSLIGIKRKNSHNRKDALLTETERLTKYNNIINASETVGFMFEERDGQIVFQYDCVKNLLPFIRVNGKTLYGAAEALFNITFFEYQVLCDYYRLFSNEHDETALNNLCAVLYRPKRKGKIKEDIRVDFDPYECSRRAEAFCSIPYEIRFLIFSWFAACDNYLKTEDFCIDGQLISLSPLFKEEKDGDNKGNLGLTAILMGVADSCTFGTVEDVRKTNLYTVMLKLYLWYQENERIKKIYNGGHK